MHVMRRIKGIDEKAVCVEFTRAVEDDHLLSNGLDTIGNVIDIIVSSNGIEINALKNKCGVSFGRLVYIPS
jgi:hypothetical protein